MVTLLHVGRMVTAGFCFLVAATSLAAEEKKWIELMPADKPLEAFDKPATEWIIAGGADLDGPDQRKLAAKEGKGVLVNGPRGRCRDLITKEKFTDVEVHVEFLIAKRSNSGVKLVGLYEIQILDSFGKKDLTGNDMGGIYPKAEDKPNYHYIDKGTPPKVNASKPAGEWQTLDIVFQAARFDDAGKKTANARFVKVVLNGQLIHENAEVDAATGTAYKTKKEAASGPLLLQSDHGPVAWRNVRIRPWTAEKKD